ncbi:MAG: ATP-binding cassette domain-containing protein, partial [Desulfitobacteriaceae bacterium]
MKQAILSVEGVSKSFGGLRALDQVNIELKQGQIKALVGPNGAGKTTLFNMITGVDFANEGTVKFKGKDITGLAPYKVNQFGLARTFQILRLFENLTALENAKVGCHRWTEVGWIRGCLRTPKVHSEEKNVEEKSLQCLEKVGLTKVAHQSAGKLPLGQRKLLEVARALASDPALLLLDEPAAGLNDSET